jgi:hypothetical protein
VQKVGQSPDELNLIKNPALAEGRTTPRGWRWIGAGEAVTWSREPSANGRAPVMTLQSAGGDATAGWARRVRCKSDEHYRIEVVVSGDLQSGDESGGLILSVQPLQGGEPVDRPLELIAPPGIRRPTRLRAYLHTPDDARSVEVQVGLARAAGCARIHEVMMFEIIEPEARSHILACPPPPYAYPAPKRVRSVCVCTQSAGGEVRPVVDLLRRRFGTRNVRAVEPARFGSRDLDADALLFPEVLPRSASNLPALEKLAAERIVIVSLPAFAAAAGAAFDVRTIKQGDDPIHSKVVEANFITRGLAIADIFPYAWRGSDPRTFVQRHFRRTLDQKEFCRRHGYLTVLFSVCNTEATTGCPMCLYKPTEGGGLVVLDIDPAEDLPTTFDEPDLAFYLLCSVLGAAQNTMGQYVCPARTEKELRREVGELGERYDGLLVRGCDHPDKPRRDQLVEVGGVDESVTVPLMPRPVILIRTGLRGDDADGVYGAMVWIKELARHEPYVNPHAAALNERFRIAWVPLGAEWHLAQGWSLPDETATLPVEADCDPEALAAVIDITSTPRRAVRVLLHDERVRRRWAELLPELARSFQTNRFFYRAVPPGRDIADRELMDWRFQALVPEVLADRDGALDTEFHRSAASAGATLIRLEFPGPQADLTCGSIWRTDLVAQTLEHVVGLLYGWIAMNRQERTLRITPPAMPPGTESHRIKMAGSEPVVTSQRITEGKAVSLPTGVALCLGRAAAQCPVTTMASPRRR